MKQTDAVLRRAYAAHEQEAPDFGTTWQLAEQRHRAATIRRRALGGLAAVVVLAALLPWRSPEAPGFVAQEELLGSTSWSAPSDVLLPSRQTDIYRELPALIESTKPEGGALL